MQSLTYNKMFKEQLVACYDTSGALLGLAGLPNSLLSVLYARTWLPYDHITVVY